MNRRVILALNTIQWRMLWVSRKGLEADEQGAGKGVAALPTKSVGRFGGQACAPQVQNE